MALDFEHGDRGRPRGHAILYFRDAGDPARCLATYLVVLPITMDVAKYLPPLLAGRLPLGDMQAVGALPLPPIPESVADHGTLVAMAERRDDDLVCGGTVAGHDLPGMIQAVADAAREYHERCEATRAREAPAAVASEDAPGEMDVRDALYGLMSEADRIAELARMTGQLRYAVQGRDEPLIAQAVADLERLGRYLHPKYRFDAFLTAARTGRPKAERLTELYVTRCYRICHHEFDALEALDGEIAALEAGDALAGG